MGMDDTLPPPSLSLPPHPDLAAPMELEAGMEILHAGVAKLKRVLAGESGEAFTLIENSIIYTVIYNLCFQRPSYNTYLYTYYKETLQDYVKSVVLPSLKEKHGEFLLRELFFRWKNHKIMVKWLAGRFAYVFTSMTRLPSKGVAKKLLRLEALGTSCFYDLVFDNMKTTIAVVVINMITDERDGQPIDRPLLKDVLGMYEEMGRDSLGLYKLYFEKPFYNSTANYYSQRAQSWMIEDSSAQYMFKAEQCYENEKKRVEHYLHPYTGPQLLKDCELELIVQRAEQILNKDNSGLKVLLRDGKTEDLRLMYRFFSKIEGGLSEVSKIFKEHVKEEGISLLKHVTHTGESKKDFAETAVKLYEKEMSFVKCCFQNDKAFHKALMEEFELFCNKEHPGFGSCAESLAAFLHDVLLKGGNEKLNDEAVQEITEKAVEVLQYIYDKDVFVEFLRKMLGRRLLLFKKVNHEQERSLLAKLKLCLGEVAISKMEDMLTDMAAAKDNQFSFEAGPANMSVSVLRRRSWPSYKSFNKNLPLEMANCVEVFKSYYDLKHEGRKLTWIYSMGSCNLIAQFDKETIELIVSTYQAALLLLFNEADQLSCAEIVTQLKELPHDEVVSLLESLWCGKYRIINKEPSSKTITDADNFQINHKFTAKRRKIQLPPHRISAELKNVMDVVHLDRRYAVDACIVRVMKTRNIIKHTELIAECIKQLSPQFKPDVHLIKKRIESLMDREFLERDEDDPMTYRYKA